MEFSISSFIPSQLYIASPECSFSYVSSFSSVHLTALVMEAGTGTPVHIREDKLNTSSLTPRRYRDDSSSTGCCLLSRNIRDIFIPFRVETPSAALVNKLLSLSSKSIRMNATIHTSLNNNMADASLNIREKLDKATSTANSFGTNKQGRG